MGCIGDRGEIVLGQLIRLTRENKIIIPETATVLGVRLDRRDNLILSAPHGIDDPTSLVVKPTP
ncbi:nucleotidyltransferase family protein [uncultured Planococcus sp.]|uniref:nucleotidyltransferase family protein n=1 Tax=uncultured Planococcus sp. TaxID=337815 RepID=UPI00344BC204